MSQQTEQQYVVVRNEEEQYSIIPDYWTIPDGWLAAGFAGSREECVAHVDKVWTDMRPRSLRECMDRQAR